MAHCEFIRYEQRDHVATVTLNRPEVLNAIHPPMAEELADAGGIHKLVRRLPWSAAMQLILTGELISAEEARRIGLVNQVVPAEGLQPAAEQWVEAILACAPLALQAGKEAAMRGLELPLREAVNTRFPLAERMYESEDFVEGPKAFAEKRKPVWKGK